MTVPASPAVLDAAKVNGEPCSYCARTMDITIALRQPTRDHIHPRSRGGTNTRSNVIWACRRCNEDKDNKLLYEWLEELIWGADPRATHVKRVVEALKDHPTKSVLAVTVDA